MRLYNKGSRSIIINRVDAINGCRILDDEIGKTKAYIDPSTEVEITDSVAEKLVTDYPKEIMKIRDSVATTSTKKKTYKKRQIPQ